MVVVGGSASGVCAALQSARMGTKTLLVEPTPWLGGMLTSAGVSAVDGCYRLRSGIWGELLDSLVAHYGNLENLRTGWVSNVMFEPSVGNAIFSRMCRAESNLTVLNGSSLKSIAKNGKKGWKLKILNNNSKSLSVDASIVIDATELGDVAKACGVKYDVGMDSRTATGESVAPDKANGIVQDLTYVAILKDYGHDVTMHRPAGYDASRFYCTCANPLCTSQKDSSRMHSKEMMMSYGRLPNGKFMINWPISGNDYYVNVVDMTPAQREIALNAAKSNTLCYIYFLQRELGFTHLGLADDEFPTADRLPLIPYYRESRRIHGLVRFTEGDISKPFSQKYPFYRTSIAVGDYPVDQHHNAYNGTESLPDLHFRPVPSYGVPMGVMIPQDVDNLIVAEKSISVTNIVNGTTRLQPVVMQIGQAAGALASIALQSAKPVASVPVRDVQNALLDAGCYLLPYLDVPNDSDMFRPLQRVGATGILKGESISQGWSNSTWMHTDSILMTDDVKGLIDAYPFMDYAFPAKSCKVTLGEAVKMIASAAKISSDDVFAKLNGNSTLSNLVKSESSRFVTRGIIAEMIDWVLNPFYSLPIDINGNFIQQHN